MSIQNDVLLPKLLTGKLEKIINKRKHAGRRPIGI